MSYAIEVNRPPISSYNLGINICICSSITLAVVSIATDIHASNAICLCSPYQPPRPISI